MENTSSKLLEEMFFRQREIARNWIPIDSLLVGDDITSGEVQVTSEERQKYLITYIALLQEEAVELLRELPARKFWRDAVKKQKVDYDAVKEEIADVWHILIAITMIVGMDHVDIFDEYVRKNEINLKRIRNKE